MAPGQEDSFLSQREGTMHHLLPEGPGLGLAQSLYLCDKLGQMTSSLLAPDPIHKMVKNHECLTHSATGKTDRDNPQVVLNKPQLPLPSNTCVFNLNKDYNELFHLILDYCIQGSSLMSARDYFKINKRNPP